MKTPKWVNDNFDKEQMEIGRIFVKITKILNNRYEYYYMPTFERFCLWIENKPQIEKMEFYQKS